MDIDYRRFRNFTDRARKVMQLAIKEAQRLSRKYVGTEHILVGLAMEGTGVAAHALKTLGAYDFTIRTAIDIVVPILTDPDVADKLTYTPFAEKSLHYAKEEADALKHNYIGTEHLLLGLLRDSDSDAVKVLLAIGLKLDDIRDEVMLLIFGRKNEPAEVGMAFLVERIASLEKLVNETIRDKKDESAGFKMTTECLETAMAKHAADADHIRRQTYLIAKLTEEYGIALRKIAKLERENAKLSKRPVDC